MPSSPLALAFLASGGLALLGYGGVKLRPIYDMLRNEPIAVRELASHSGPIEVVGTSVPDDGGAVDSGLDVDATTVVAPFSGRSCLAYEYTVEEYRQSGKTGHWETLAEGGAGVPFLVDDGGDLVPVDPTGADLRLAAHVTTVDAGEEPPEHVERFVADSPDVDPNDRTIDLRLFELNVGSPQRFVERRLDVGEDVYVYGTVRRPEEAPDWGSDRVDAVIEAGDGTSFLISDTSERGTAWRLARWPLAVAVVGGVVLLVVAWLAIGLL